MKHPILTVHSTENKPSLAYKAPLKPGSVYEGTVMVVRKGNPKKGGPELVDTRIFVNEELVPGEFLASCLLEEKPYCVRITRKHVRSLVSNNWNYSQFLKFRLADDRLAGAFRASKAPHKGKQDAALGIVDQAFSSVGPMPLNHFLADIMAKAIAEREESMINEFLRGAPSDVRTARGIAASRARGKSNITPFSE